MRCAISDEDQNESMNEEEDSGEEELSTIKSKATKKKKKSGKHQSAAEDDEKENLDEGLSRGSLTCAQCNGNFPSKNKLYAHLKVTKIYFHLIFVQSISMKKTFRILATLSSWVAEHLEAMRVKKRRKGAKNNELALRNWKSAELWLLLISERNHGDPERRCQGQSWHSHQRCQDCLPLGLHANSSISWVSERYLSTLCVIYGKYLIWESQALSLECLNWLWPAFSGLKISLNYGFLTTKSLLQDPVAVQHFILWDGSDSGAYTGASPHVPIWEFLCISCQNESLLIQVFWVWSQFFRAATLITFKESCEGECEVKQSFDFCRSFIGREETREMGLDLKELKELTASFKNASVRRNVNEDQVKQVFSNPC